MGTSQSPLLSKEIEFSDPITIEYFKEINKLLRKTYESNTDILDNYEFSLQKKDFTNQNAISHKLYDDEENWLDFFQNYLLRQGPKGHEWAEKLYNQINRENFLFESKYKSLFFFEEYSITTQPKCLKEYVKKEEENAQEENSDIMDMPQGNYSELSLTENFGGSFLSVDSNAYEVGDPALDYLHSRNKVKEYIRIFKSQLSAIDHPIHIIIKHFTDLFPESVAKKIKELNEMLTRNCDDYQEKVNDVAKSITHQLQKFIVKVHTAFKLMYCATINYMCFSEEKDEVINLVASHIFKNGKVYDCIYDLYQMSLSDTIKNLEYKLYQLKDVKPEDLGIQIKFCLNNKTFELQKKLFNEKSKLGQDVAQREEDKKEEQRKAELMKSELIKSDMKKMEIKKDEVKRLTFLNKNIKKTRETVNASNSRFGLDKNKDIFPDKKQKDQKNKEQNSNIESSHDLSIDEKLIEEKPRITINNSNVFHFKAKKKAKERESLTNNTNQSKAKIPTVIQEEKDDEGIEDDKEMNEYAYSSAVRLLQSVKKYRLPFEKMMVIASLSAEVTECISNFWKDMENSIHHSLLDLDADELMTIFIYIIIKSQLSELAIHTKIVKAFTTTVTKSTTIGYYYTTLDASITLIQENTKEELIKNEQTKMARISKAV